MKKCFYFPTWEEREDVMISLDGSYIIFKNDIYNISDNVLSFVSSELEHDDLAIYFNGYKHGGYGQAYRNISRIINDKDFVGDIIIEQSTPSDPILAKLCELTGAKMYGDYVVLNTKTLNFPSRNITISSSDICAKTKNTGLLCSYVEKYILMNLDTEQPKNFFPFNIEDEIQEMEKNKLHIDRGFNKLSKKRKIEVALEQGGGFYYIMGNIFEQYSLFLQGKENQWEEVKDVLGV